jgi:hypothetical protein
MRQPSANADQATRRNKSLNQCRAGRLREGWEAESWMRRRAFGVHTIDASVVVLPRNCSHDGEGHHMSIHAD